MLTQILSTSCSWEEREVSSTSEPGLPVYWKVEIPLLYLSLRSHSGQMMNACVCPFYCWQHPEDRGFYWPLPQNSSVPVPPRLFAVPSAAAQFSSETDLGQDKCSAWHFHIIYGFSRRPVKLSRLYIALCDCTAKLTQQQGKWSQWPTAHQLTLGILDFIVQRIWTFQIGNINFTENKSFQERIGHHIQTSE